MNILAYFISPLFFNLFFSAPVSQKPIKNEPTSKATKKIYAKISIPVIITQNLVWFKTKILFAKININQSPFKILWCFPKKIRSCSPFRENLDKKTNVSFDKKHWFVKQL
jgi:hypothetical protein